MMKKSIVLVTVFATGLHAFSQSRNDSIECWRRFETTFKGPQAGNPFTDVSLTAEFSKGNVKYIVNGFYDGDGNYKIRFMPTQPGEWKFTTRSNKPALNGKTGSFYCKAASAKNHGPVAVSNTYYFKYADGKPYHPFGTTLYAWTHMGEQLQELTLTTLKNSPFNKVRMCVFPKTYTYIKEEPPYYPYEQKGTKNNTDGKVIKVWDLTRFNPDFFHHLEKRIDDLDALGIETDLIIFHPYDQGRWGFDSLGKRNDLNYINYLTARLSSFKNIWWSMANEYDFIKSKSKQDWNDYISAVVKNDPYKHLCSIHNGSDYFDHWNPGLTHVSIQNSSAVEDFGRATLLRDVYSKPVIYDEVGYEGNIPQRWGRLSGEEMTHDFWQGIIAGTYVTHGETYKNKGDTVFWSKGGRLIGSSPSRIGFLKKIVEEAPGPLKLADVWKDHKTATVNRDYYLVYFGKDIQTEWPFSLPGKNGPAVGGKYKVEVIDTWNMTILPISDTFEISPTVDYRRYDKENKKIRLSMKPYLALRITRVD